MITVINVCVRLLMVLFYLWCGLILLEALIVFLLGRVHGVMLRRHEARMEEMISRQ